MRFSLHGPLVLNTVVVSVSVTVDVTTVGFVGDEVVGGAGVVECPILVVCPLDVAWTVVIIVVPLLIFRVVPCVGVVVVQPASSSS